MARSKKNTETKVENTINEEDIEVTEKVKENKIETSKSGKRMSRKRNNSQNKYINLDRDRVVPVVSVSSFPVGYVNKETNKCIKWNIMICLIYKNMKNTKI